MSTSNPLKTDMAWSAPVRHPPHLMDYPIRSAEKLRFADTDCNGHISNAVFAVCCQNARMELLHDPRRVPLPIDAQFVIVRFEIDFLGEMHWPGTVVIGTRCERIGRTSLTVAQVLFIDGSCAASARSTVALMDRATRRATPLPPETASALEGFRAPQNGTLQTCWQGQEG
ncbi:MAG: acyl-CoA thioesterase [Hyphomicrobium sp.]|nr:acyl-CoA thioesterase [Hyphomicrobium sp.]MBN9276458.1 acyl-CoA thioesterase [Hyphomicrobium sp.]